MNPLRQRLLFLGICLLTAQASAQINLFDDVVAGTIGGQPLQLDLRVPRGEGPVPLAIYIHGGGWQSGSHNQQPRYGSRLLEEGIAVASLQYRLTSQAADWGGEPVTFPAQIHDVKAGIRFLRANAERYRLDPDRFVVYGASAGGHLAMLAGVTGNVPELEGRIGGNEGISSAVSGFVSICGPSDLLNMGIDQLAPPGSRVNHDAPDSPESKLVGFSGDGQGLGVLRENLDNPMDPFPFYRAIAEQAAPVTWADPGDPPGFVMHGTGDTSVPWPQAQRMADALTAAGVPHTLLLADGLAHVVTTPEIDEQIIAFMKQVLQGDDTADQWALW